MPGLTAASSITCSASPSRSRASSVEKLSPMIGATSRCGLGNGPCSGACRHAQTIAASANSHGDLLHILDLDPLAGDALRQSGGHEPVEVAVEHVTRRS